jgi:BirA family biotin operon repressor/biotin-[acetyl-CoA-carboxylase] ligase
VLRDPPRLLTLAAAVAVADVAGAQAKIKWPNDVLLDGRKVGGILAEGRPLEGWAVLGIGLNVALRPEDLPGQLRTTAGTLGLDPADLEPTLDRLLRALESALALDDDAVLDAYRARDALSGRAIRWADGAGRAVGVDSAGRLVVELATGGRTALSAGEVHLEAEPAVQRRGRESR